MTERRKAHTFDPVYYLDRNGHRQCICRGCYPEIQEEINAPQRTEQEKELTLFQPQPEENPRQ